ncbi:hypothetical protein RRG08_019759, partial [Elysia crispata]
PPMANEQARQWHTPVTDQERSDACRVARAEGRVTSLPPGQLRPLTANIRRNGSWIRI